MNNEFFEDWRVNGCPNCGGKGYTFATLFWKANQNDWCCVWGHSRSGSTKGCGATGKMSEWPKFEIDERLKYDV